MKKIDGITMVKGLGAIVILFYHFFQQYLPAVINDNPELRRYSWEAIISETPLYAFVNAQFWIAVFWSISGFLLSYWFYKYLRQKKVKFLVGHAVKKYIVYVVPLVVVSIFSWLLKVCGGYFNKENANFLNTSFGTLYEFEPNFFEALKEAFCSCWFLGEAKYNPVLWTMKVELFGTVLVLCFLYIFGKCKRGRCILWFLLGTVCIVFDVQFLAIVMGAFAGDIYCHYGCMQNKVVKCLAIISAMCLGGVPFMHTRQGVYVLFPALNPWVYYAVASFILLMAIPDLSGNKNIFCACLNGIGKKSFSIYIIHFVIQCSVSSLLGILLGKNIPLTYGELILLILIAHILIVACASILYDYYAQKWMNFIKQLFIRVIGQ